MLYLIEGSDGLGKTTLAKSLQWLQRCAYVHHCPPPRDWQREDFLTVLPRAVYDRFHWSMWAYKEVNQQPLDLSVENCAAIDERLALMLDGDYFTVCLYASDPAYFDGLPPDHMLSVDAVKSVNERYISELDRFSAALDVCKGYPSAEQICDLVGF